MQKAKAYMNWSGGKDSALCLQKAWQSKSYQIDFLLTSVNATYDRVSMHGVRRSLLEAQSHQLGIPLKTIELSEQPGMLEYETAMMKAVQELKDAGCTHSIFGDIFLEDLRKYREEKLKALEITGVFPIWHVNTTTLVKEFIDLGFKAIVVCINEKFLDKSFCGRVLDHSFLQDLPPDVDPCGENGEFHSFVYEAPIFKESIPVEKGEIIYRKYQAPKSTDNSHVKANPSQFGFYFCDLVSQV